MNVIISVRVYALYGRCRRGERNAVINDVGGLKVAIVLYFVVTLCALELTVRPALLHYRISPSLHTDLTCLDFDL